VKKGQILPTEEEKLITVDLTGVPGAQAGDVAAVISRDGEVEITPYEVAGKARVYASELLTRINPLIRKFCI